MFRQLHHRFVFLRRVRVLSQEISSFIGNDVITVLDIGSGDGSVSRSIQEIKPGLKITGIDTMARPSSAIPFRLYDGKQIPFEDNSVDACMLVDVLHHAVDIPALLAEAKRVSAKYILIKDHQYNSDVDFRILKFMDDVGNKAHHVALEYNYLKEEQWKKIFKESRLTMIRKITGIPLYPFPFNLVFGRKLHFIAMLEKL